MKALTLFATLLIFFSATLTLAQEFNAGIVQGLWYSQEKIFVGDTVRIYVAIRNNTGSDLSGTVDFYDGERRIERQNVQALSGRIIESWADWKPSYGSHDLSATLSRTEIHTTSTQAIEVTSAVAKDTIFVDYDTDGDDIGNEDDRDDDDDGLSDAKEKSDGTDPLVKNVIKETATTAETSSSTNEQEAPNSNDIDENDENDPNGLEQYLAESPAENVFTTVTRYINAAKQNLDTYREKREEARTTQASTTPSDVNAEGFGEISREQGGEQTVEEKGDEHSGFFDKLFGFIGTVLNGIYTFILAALSFILAHPIFVQVGILIVILFVIVKLASKFGRRRSSY